ncbi:MAG: hypothetical protein CALGDGBN_02754 [Pseudomonadales bacterium]|nr:hypothetical protein [Pseudomonadales bacterium]
MRLVIDTNLVVAGFLWGGIPGQLVQAGIDRRITLVTSAILIEELAGVLGRAKFAKHLRANGITSAGLITRYTLMTEIVEPVALKRRVARDPDDDHVLACAVAAQADAIVSGDKDPLVLKAYRGTRIVTAREALDFLISIASNK